MPKLATKTKIVMGVACFLVAAAAILLWLGNGVEDGMPNNPEACNEELVTALATAAESYKTDNGPFPKNLDNHILWFDLSGADSGKVYMSFTTNQQNDKGEIVDPWGTPYRVWYISDKEIGITSAGPDKIFGTDDDITNQ
jgi:hypothetical protein